MQLGGISGTGMQAQQHSAGLHNFVSMVQILETKLGL